MNLNKPMASSIGISHFLHISNKNINQKIKLTINILKSQHVMNQHLIRKNFIKTSYYYKKEHTCYLLSRVGCNYLIATLHLATNVNFKLIQRLHIHFQHPENKLQSKYNKSVKKLHKNTLASAFAKIQNKQLNQHLSIGESFYLLRNMNYINKDGLPTALMQQSGLYKDLMTLIIKHHKQMYWHTIRQDSRKAELKDMNYCQLLCQQLLSYAYNLESSEFKFKSYLIQLGRNLCKYDSLIKFLKSCSKNDLQILLYAGFCLKSIGKNKIVSYQEHTLTINFNIICKYYIKTMPTVDAGLDSINSIIHRGIIND